VSQLRVLFGAVLILLGGIVIARGVSYTTSRNVVDLGGIRVSADEKKPVAPWIGGIAALAGLALVFTSGSRKR
jgi:hypothetical protein